MSKPPMNGLSSQEVSLMFGCDQDQAERILQNQAIAEMNEREWRRKVVSWTVLAVTVVIIISIIVGYKPDILPFGWTLKDVGIGVGVAGMIIGFVATVIF